MKNMSEIRDILCEEIDRVRSGRAKVNEVNTIIKATNVLLTTVKMELDYAKLLGKKPDMKFIDEPKQVSEK
jgi:hypothetical protein